MAFALFILVNAALFVRPAELVPAADGLPIYNIIICSCLAVSFNTVSKQITTRNLTGWPISLCVVGLFFAVVCSHLCHFNFERAQTDGIDFFKIVLYYLLVVALINTPLRLRKLLIWMTVFALVLTVVALLDYHDYIHLPKIVTANEHMGGDEDGITLRRLCATGIFDNPNDLARLMVIGITICIFAIMEKGASQLRLLWIAPMVVFAYALMLTYSRGGLLALFAGLAVLFAVRFGWRKTVLTCAVVVPLLMVLFGGRQTDFDVQNGTGQHRIQLWAEGFEMLRTSPLFGIGVKRMAEEIGYVAHNSFVQAYVEMGFLGGTLFTGAFFLAVYGIYRLPKRMPTGADAELWRFRPYILSILIGTIVGMLSSTRTYNLPTYMVLGIAASYIRLTAEVSPVPQLRFNAQLIRQLGLVSCAFFVATYLYIRLAVHWE